MRNNMEITAAAHDVDRKQATQALSVCCGLRAAASARIGGQWRALFDTAATSHGTAHRWTRSNRHKRRRLTRSKCSSHQSYIHEQNYKQKHETHERFCLIFMHRLLLILPKPGVLTKRHSK